LSVSAFDSGACARSTPRVLDSQDGPGHGECDVFVAPDGKVKEVLCYDYGFRSGFGRLYQGGDGEIPKSFLALVRPAASGRAVWHAAPCMLSTAE